MNTCAGAPFSICLASAELAAYEVTALAPPCRTHSAFTASSDSLRLAAAKTRSVSCACTGKAKSAANALRRECRTRARRSLGVMAE